MATGTTSTSMSGFLSDVETNYLRAAHLVIHICPKAVRKLFDTHHPPSQLTGDLAAKQATLQNCKGIDKRHWPMLFPTHGVVKSSDFDITLLMALLRNFTHIQQPRTGWDKMPTVNDKSRGADLVRIRLYRNQIVHSSEATLAHHDFNVLWTALEDAIDRLSGGTMKKEVNDCRFVVLDQTQRELLLTSLEHEKEIKQIKQKHDEEMKEQRTKIETIKQKHEEEMKQQRTEIETIKQKHEDEVKQQREEIKQIQEKHEKQMRETIPHNVKVQHRYTLGQWKKDDMVFYETTGYKGALELLNSKNYITIIASPGAGKSSTAQHIALKMENEGWEVVPIDGPDELIKYGSYDKKQVFVIDDVVGVLSVEMALLDAFSRRQKQILNLIQNQTKLIMTCRKVVYNEIQKSKSLLTNFVIDLESSDFKLLDNEKSEILLNHCKAVKISPELCENIPLSNAKVMFPLLCKIFCSERKYQKMGKIFFERPNECLLEKLEDMKERFPLQYAGLTLLCLKKKKILSKKDCESDENFLSLKKTVFDNYGVNYGTPASEIIKALSLLDGTYTRPASDGFTFIHDSIFELVAYHHGQSYPEHILKYSSSSYVNKRVTVDEPPSDGSLYIKLEKKHYPLLAERILDDIRTLKLYEVFKNLVLKNGEFLDAFISILKLTDFRDFEKIILESHQEPDISELEFEMSDTSDESFSSDSSDDSYMSEKMKKEADLWMFFRTRLLLETDDTRVIRWIVFYGPTRLLEFVINHVKRRTNIVKGLVNKVTKQSSKSLFGEKKEQTRFLVIVCCSGDVDRVRLILQHVDPSCVNTNFKDSFWGTSYTPLTAACFWGHLPVVDVLIQHHARVDIPDNTDNTPLYIAILEGHCDIVRYLINHGADPNISGYATPLYEASKGGHCDIVRYLIEHGADPNKHMCDRTPLYIASRRGHCDIVRYLIDHGADPNIHCKYTGTPLYNASERGHCVIVRYLIDHGADPNIPDYYGYTPLYKASGGGHFDIVRYLIDHGADPNIPDNGKTPLYKSSELGHRDIVSLLLDNGADVNISNDDGTSPLRISMYHGKMDVLRMIVKHSNKLRTNEGNNLLYNELILLKHLEVNEEEKSRRGRIVFKASKSTPLPCKLGWVITMEKTDVMRQLLMLGLDVNHCDERGRSLLCRMICQEFFSYFEREEKVKLLLESGADVNIRDNKCVSVIEHTRQRVCQYYRKKMKYKQLKIEYNKNCNMLNAVKCHVRRYSV